MPILLALVAASVVLATQLSSVGFFGQSAKVDANFREISQRLDLIREIGPYVRQSYDLSESNAGVCPATSGTILKSVKNGKGATQGVCWKTAESGCLSATSGQQQFWVCPVQAGNVFARWRLLFPREAYAVIPYSGPKAVAVPGNGISLNRPNCSGTPRTTPCIDCAVAGTTCLTIKFCIGTTRVSSCPDEEVTQTFAFREYL